MLGLRFYASAATQMFRRATFTGGIAMRTSSSNMAAVEAAGSSPSSSPQSTSGQAKKEAQDGPNMEAENVKKTRRKFYGRHSKFFVKNCSF